jgi:hypothetical protein
VVEIVRHHDFINSKVVRLKILCRAGASIGGQFVIRSSVLPVRRQWCGSHKPLALLKLANLSHIRNARSSIGTSPLGAKRSFGEPTALEAKVWLTSPSCRKAKKLGYPHELWTTRLLARHARELGPAEGHPVPNEKWPSREQPRQIDLAQAQGEGAQILAIERQDVERIRLDFIIVLARVQDIEIGNTVNPKDDSFAINELICSTSRTTRRVLQTSQK